MRGRRGGELFCGESKTAVACKRRATGVAANTFANNFVLRRWVVKAPSPPCPLLLPLPLPRENVGRQPGSDQRDLRCDLVREGRQRHPYARRTPGRRGVHARCVVLCEFFVASGTQEMISYAGRERAYVLGAQVLAVRRAPRGNLATHHNLLVSARPNPRCTHRRDDVVYAYRHPRLPGQAQLRQRTLGRPLGGPGERYRQGRRHPHGHVDPEGWLVFMRAVIRFVLGRGCCSLFALSFLRAGTG